jgi:hypothetical protein
MNIRHIGTGAAGALATLLLGSCGGDFTFEMDVNFEPDGTNPASTTFSTTQAVDLTTNPDAWKHRDKLDKVDITGTSGTCTSVAGNNLATTGSGTITFIPDGGGTGTVVANWTGVTIGPGSTIEVDMTQAGAAEAFLKSALKGTGKFSVKLDGTTDAPPHFFATVTFRVKVRYNFL